MVSGFLESFGDTPDDKAHFISFVLHSAAWYSSKVLRQAQHDDTLQVGQGSQGSQVLSRKPVVLHAPLPASAAPSALGFSPGGGDTPLVPLTIFLKLRGAI